VWEKTGPGEITLTAIIFGFDLDGNVIWTARVTEVLTFGEDYETAVGAAMTEIWLYAVHGVPDFRDPPPPDYGPIPWEDHWTRLHIVE
jgi:hypothetical protein